MSISKAIREIVATLADVIACGDPRGHLEALREVLDGTIDQDMPIGGGFVPAHVARRLAILDIAARRGRVVNKDVRQAFGVSSESVRQDLKALCDAGALVRHGTRAEAWYSLAGDAQAQARAEQALAMADIERQAARWQRGAA